MSEHPLATYLRDHPRMIGVLFTMTLLLSQAGAVAANNAFCIKGP
ncbi:DUF7503 family protein [Haloprofundus marisrubri]|nr:hypothetical protein [Haloprofundus marisrubri]